MGDTDENSQESETNVIIVMCILLTLALIGSIGNALVLYIFSNLKQKLTSTVFILALATFDFVTCLITMPFTAAVEYLHFKLEYGMLCKLYHFFMSSPVVFSAICMVGIAVDRYLCICHPFKHAMTIKRAQIVVFSLAVFALMLGIIACLFYGVKDMTEVLTFNHTAEYPNGTLPYGMVPVLYNTSQLFNTSLIVNTTNINQTQEATMKGACSETYDILGKDFFFVFQKVYSSLFLISCIVVAVLYSLIYRSVMIQRKKKMRILSASSVTCCFFCTKHPDDGGFDQTEITTMIPDHHTEKTVVDGNGVTHNGVETRETATDNKTEKVEKVDKHEKHKAMRQGSISRKARMEKMRMANIKTALMLFVVTLVYIVAFLPAWLMALRLIDMNIIVFYTYFVYNVANPFIYAFMNQNFRNQLHELFNCKT